jgi:hypothetical protein
MALIKTEHENVDEKRQGYGKIQLKIVFFVLVVQFYFISAGRN